MSDGPASLLLAHKPHGRILLVIGEGKLALQRARTAVGAGMRAVLAWHTPLDAPEPHIESVTVEHDTLFPASEQQGACADAWERLIDDIDTTEKNLFAVCVTDTLATVVPEAHARRQRCEVLARACRARRLPLNVTDVPDLCDYAFPATHSFPGAHDSSSLQIAVTTNGKGCRLAGRIRRHIVSSLPASVGVAVDRIGDMRERAKSAACHVLDAGTHEDEPSLGDTLGYQASTEHTSAPDACALQRRRMHWIAQISEYWPLDKLAALTPSDIKALLETDMSLSSDAESDAGERAAKRSRHELAVVPQSKGRVFLLGSGPGHPGLLTVAARDILTSPTTDLILSDKLVPTAVLALIPPTTPLVIAKKFPGNAEGAQSELIAQALEAAQQGKTVVRLKQGDPYVYGRGGEELVACQNAGIECTVVPGISSAMAGPLMVGIPVTQRGAAETFVMCTGVGRGGKRVRLPGYERSRTMVVLMGVARLAAVVDTLLAAESEGRDGPAFPPYTPMAIIERASSEDQRMIATTIERIVDVMEHRVADGQRPPGMLVVGWAVLSLTGPVAGARVLDDEAHCAAEHADASEAAQALAACDRKRIDAWLGAPGFRIVEGLPSGFERFPGASALRADDATSAPRSATGWAAPRYGPAPAAPDAPP
ncbi:uroporphyrinogen-III C-methyltransferase [Malassezia caprae]|uniref:precorrin-2 dehydrogenase n=1 Tax=Malassezia caprae TaxID=1381934 RepID=A0AAF0E9F3_9BASI|nr:uroporphyrinogen-III C-methyltransferase [Malassezia caprae]